MILRIFSVYDSAAEAFLPPFFLSSAGLALRTFIEAANDQAHQFYKHGADFTLFELGTFDPQLGKFDLLIAPRSLANALTMRQEA